MKATLKIFVVALTLSLILTVGTAVAAEDMTFNQGDLSVSSKTDNMELDHDDSAEIDSDCSKSQDDHPDSFHDLQVLIDNSTGDVINLEKDYVYNNDTDSYLSIHDRSPIGDITLFTGDSDRGILINKSVTINGNGHSIDAGNMTRIFNIVADNVVLKNITFLNANCFDPHATYSEVIMIGGPMPLNAVVYDSGKFGDEALHYFGLCRKGGAIYCSGNGLKITDSTFKGNIADIGGAIYIDGPNSQLSNLTFSNNTSNDGGAVFVSGKNATILKSEFDSNRGLYVGASISSSNDINIQNCRFINCNRRSVVFYGGNWQIDNMNSTYYNSFVKFPPELDFEYELTHTHEEYYNLKITFGVRLYSLPNCPFVKDDHGYSKSKSFSLNVNGKDYNLRTDENSQAELNLKIPNGYCTLKVHNPITNFSRAKSFNVGPNMYNYTNYTDSKVEKSTPKLIVKGKVFAKKSKSKLYSVVLKGKGNKALKKAWISLKINKKSYKAKTNNKGKATFRIKLNKKGTFRAKITFKGDKNYKKISKSVKIKIR